MEGYLKTLFDDLDASDRTEFRIVDDNFNSSQSSLPNIRVLERKRRKGRKKRSVRRAHSLNSMAVVGNSNSDDDGSEACGSSPHDSESAKNRSEQTPVPKDRNDIDRRIRLSPRMERHRKSRWDATPSSSSRQPESPAIRRPHRPHRSSSVPSSMEPKNSVDLRTAHYLARNRSQRRAISATRECGDERVVRDRMRTPSSLVPPRFLGDDEALTQHRVISKAIEISCADLTSTCDTMPKRTKASSRRVKVRTNPSKSDSMIFPPSVPVRRLSNDAGYDDSRVDIMDGPRIKIPQSLRELPYHKCSHSV